MAHLWRLGGGTAYGTSLGRRRIRVRFTLDERMILYDLAEQRNWRKGDTNERADWYGLGHVDANLIGLMGEAAFAVYQGREFNDLQVYRGHGDDGVDFNAGGKTWQVKCTSVGFNRPYLKFGEWENARADLYVLAAWDLRSYGKPSDVDLIGYIERDELLAQPFNGTLENFKRLRIVPDFLLSALDDPPPTAYEALGTDELLARLDGRG